MKLRWMLAIAIGIFIVLAVSARYLYRSYLALDESSVLADSTPITVNQPTKPSEKKSLTEADIIINVVAENLFVPWDIVFTSQDRMLVTQRNGEIVAIRDGVVSAPLLKLTDIATTSEAGLMGMTLDPNYTNNNYLYICYAYEKNGELVDKVVRLIDQQTSVSIDTTMIDNIPAAHFHAGCSVRFGPDQKLYISTGDARTPSDAQDTNSLAGKILRLNPNGSIPSDNPIAGSPVWSYGHRNPQGIDWHPTTGDLWSSEHGPSVVDGPAGGDEINLITKNANYGWPVVSHEKKASGMVHPQLVFTPAIAPGSAHFYRSAEMPQLRGDLLVGMLKGEGLLRVVLSEENPQLINFYQKLPGIDAGRVRIVTTGQDGAIYFASSNRDGRGSPQDGDDKIYRLTLNQ